MHAHVSNTVTPIQNSRENSNSTADNKIVFVFCRLSKLLRAMKRGGRSRKRKTSNNSSVVVSSAVVSLEDSPKQCLTQNSHGKFVPCFSKKPRLAIKPSSAVESIPTTTEALTQAAAIPTNEGETEAPERPVCTEVVYKCSLT